MADPWAVVSTEPIAAPSDPWAVVSKAPVKQGVKSTEATLPGSTPLLRKLAPIAPPPTQFEQERPGAGMSTLQHVGDFIKTTVSNLVPSGGAASPYANMAAPTDSAARNLVETTNKQAAEQLDKERAFRKEQGYNPVYRGLAEVAPFAMVNPAGAEQAAAQGRTGGVLGNTAGPPAAMAAIPQVIKGVGKVGSAVARGVTEPLAPKIVRIEGVDMPVLAGEAAEVPTTLGERAQVALKRAGAAPDEFTAIETQQQNAVKQVIRNVVQKTTDLTGPLPESPTGAVLQGAEASFEQARPIYQALDASLTHVPVVLDEFGTLTQKAIGRLRAKGLEIGNTYNPEQPLQSTMAIRSELLEIQRAARRSGDTLKAKIAGDEAGMLDGDIAETLQHSRIPGLYQNWRQANAIWKRGIALRDVADVIDSSIKGTPVEAQVNVPGEIGARPVEINAASLVEKFNDLAKDGTLDNAFGPGYSRSVRQVTEFLKRAQETNIGNRTARLSGYSPRSAVGHTIVDFFYRLGGGQIAKLMTDTQGAKLVANLTGATTPEQVVARTAAIQNRLASGQYNQPSGIVPPAKALPSGQAALPPAGSIQPPPPPTRGALPPASGAPIEPVYEGEYVETPIPRGPRIARPQPPPPSGPIAMPPPERPSLPLPRQQALPPARSIQLPNVSDSTMKLLSKTRGFTNIPDVMEAAKNGTITPAEAARITKLLGGKAAEVTRRITKPEPPPTGPQGGHAGGGVTSVEELSRPGTNYIVSKSGSVTYHGKSFAPEVTPRDGAHVTVLPDGQIRVNAGTLTEAQLGKLKKALAK